MRGFLGRVSAAVMVGLLAGTSAALAVPGPAAAVDIKLTSTDPPQNTTVPAPPERITLTFDGEPSKAASTVSILGPGGENSGAGDLRVDGNTVSLRFQAKVTGVHTVAWGTIAPDGDPLGGAFRFTLASLTPSTARPSAGPAVPSAPSPTPATPDVPEDGQARPEEPAEEPTPWWPYAVGAVVVLALLVGAGRFLGQWFSRRRES